MIRSVAKYVSFDDKKESYRVVLKGKHIGYWVSFAEAIRQRNIYCVKLGIDVPTDVAAEPIPISVTHIPDKRK